MKKKLLSLALAGALALSVNSVAFAAATKLETPAPDGLYSSTVEASSEVKVPTIDITLSDTASKKIGLNPYKLKYTIDSINNGTDQIVNKVETITNASDVKIKVNATTTAKVNGEAVMATAALKGTETTKSVFAYLQIDADTAAKTDATMTAVEYNTKTENVLAFATKATTKKAMVTLDDKDTASGKKVASYKIFGSVAPNPTKAWTAADTVDFTVVFQFEPVVATTGA